MTQRIHKIADAATSLFLTQGYGKTQISHIARAVGVSVGTIYHDFVGKEEILHYILQCAIDPAFAERDLPLPIRDDLFPELEQQIGETFERSAAAFAAPLAAGLVNYRFETLLSDAFDLLSQYAAGCLFIEKNQYEFPRLAAQYRAYRGRFFAAMTDYLAAFTARGEIRPVEDAELTTVLIVEMLTWWAMDVRYTSFETRAVPPDAAKRVCLDNLLTAYRA